MMTGMITLMDGGQNYIEFDLACGVIEEVRPSGLRGWRGTKILNKELVVGGSLLIDLQWKDYDLPLKYEIIKVDYGDVPGGEWLMANMSAEPALYTSPITYVDHMAYDVWWKGIPLYFDCVNKAAIAAANALKATDHMPGCLLVYLEGMQLVSEANPASQQTIAGLKDYFMTIFNDSIIDVGIIAHEATHAWAMAKWFSYFPPMDGDYQAAIDSGEPPVTEYGKTDSAEDLAESVRYYVYDIERLKRDCPIRYPIVHKLMTDPDYRG